eukprot:m.145255 g.145255  ORF g.145255 m.145255 type:complete len:87 (+) comp52675_c1_seq9:3034-3294(+)
MSRPPKTISANFQRDCRSVQSEVVLRLPIKCVKQQQGHRSTVTLLGPKPKLELVKDLLKKASAVSIQPLSTLAALFMLENLSDSMV